MAISIGEGPTTGGMRESSGSVVGAAASGGASEVEAEEGTVGEKAVVLMIC